MDCQRHGSAGQELGAPGGWTISAEACAACEAASAYGLQGVVGLKFSGLMGDPGTRARTYSVFHHLWVALTRIMKVSAMLAAALF